MQGGLVSRRLRGAFSPGSGLIQGSGFSPEPRTRTYLIAVVTTSIGISKSIRSGLSPEPSTYFIAVIAVSTGISNVRTRQGPRDSETTPTPRLGNDAVTRQGPRDSETKATPGLENDAVTRQRRRDSEKTPTRGLGNDARTRKRPPL